MAGITFPNVAGTLAPLMQLDLAAERNAFDRERARRADEADTREREASQHVPAALGGDREALSRIAVASPGLLTKLVPMLDRMDAAARTRAKEATEWTARAAMGVLSLPPDQRPAAYQAALAEGQSLGFKIDMPPQYDRAVEGRLNQILNQTRTFENYWKDKNEGVTFAPPVGGGQGGGGVNSFNIGNVRPVGGGPNSGFQQPASLEEGIRLTVNNVKAYPGKFNNGQPMTLLQIGERWAPRGDGANDPVQWAKNVASIGGLDPTKPLDFNDPQTAAAFARGVHGAEHGANKVLPIQQYAQAITGNTASDAGGNVPPAMAPLRGLQLPPGARVALQNGVPIVKDGTVLYLDANGGWGAVPLPQRAAPKEQGTGPFAGNSVEAQALNMMIANGTLTPQQAAELAAGKTITNPADGSVLFMTPSGLFGQKPGQGPQPVGGGAPGGQAPQAGAPPAAAPGSPATQSGMIPVTPPKPTQMTEGQANAALYADRIRAAEKVIAETEAAGLDLIDKGLSAVPVLGNKMVSEGYQRYEQARRDFINAVLRRESGAVISDAEFANAEKQYFPQPGDKPEVLKQKANNRRIALEGISRAAGPSYKPEAATSAAPVPATPKPAQGSADRGRVLFEARDAISKGADPAKVKERLKSLGIEEEP